MGWYLVDDLENFPQNEARPARVNGKLLAIFNVGGTCHATDPFCTHARAKLVDGFFENGIVECPLHEGRFDVATGKALCPPLTRDLRCYPAKVTDEQLFVELPDPDTQIAGQTEQAREVGHE